MCCGCPLAPVPLLLLFSLPALQMHAFSCFVWSIFLWACFAATDCAFLPVVFHFPSFIFPRPSFLYPILPSARPNAGGCHSRQSFCVPISTIQPFPPPKVLF